MNTKNIIKACRRIIDKHNDHNTLYELLETEMADGLTFYEAELVCSALDNYYSGATTQWTSGAYSNGKKDTSDTTPYDIVKILKDMDNSNTLYYQVTACDRWGYEMESDSNADYFDNLLHLVIEGKANEAFMIANENGTSGFDPCKYKDIVKGCANNNGERIVYDDFNHIMTFSSTSYTIYRKLTDQELKDWEEQN